MSEPQLTLPALFSPMANPLMDLRGMIQETKRISRLYTTSGCDKELITDSTSIIRHLEEFSMTIEGMALLLGNMPAVIDDAGLTEYPFASNILDRIAAVTPMLVGAERAVWVIDSKLSSATIRSAAALYNILVHLIVPLSVVSTKLQIKANYLSLTSVKNGIADETYVLNSEVAEFGALDIEVLAWFPFSGGDILSSVESAVFCSIDNLGTARVKPFSKVYDVSTGAVTYSFSVLCSRTETADRSSSCLRVKDSNSDSRDESMGVEERKKNISVLVVDDSPMIVKMLSRMLGKLGCDVDSAENGQVAVDKIKARAECSVGSSDRSVEMYDLVFMDFLMPVMDGLEAMRSIKYWREESHVNNAACANMLLIGLSATANVPEQQEGFTYGMHYFVSKPINVGLLSKIHEWKLAALSLEEIVQNMKDFLRVQPPTSSS